MRFALWPSLNRPWKETADAVRHADETGWDGVYVADHFMPNAEQPADGPTFECWTAMAGLAAITEKVRIGALVSGNTYRHPAVLAKEAVTVDHISNGRAVLGLGAGWQANEHAAYGLEYGTFRERFDKLEEACQIILGMRDQQRTTLAGTHYSVSDAPADPKPIGKLPLLIGGTGEQRTLRIVARFADEWNMWGTPDAVAQKSAVLEQRCEEAGRDPKTIQRCAQTPIVVTDDPAVVEKLKGRGLVGSVAEVQEALGAYVEAGLDELIFPTFLAGGDAEAQRDAADRFLEEVAAPFRG
jgi:F420-dependent oxidoreductase-like protein